MNKINTDILIVGGGPAGMAAAVGAACKTTAKITIIDDNPTFGGQIWRAELSKIKSPEARELIRKLDSDRIELTNGGQVFGQADERTLLTETKNGTHAVEFEKLIIATGARERFLPFPGWTLPNVFGAGGLQALVKGGLTVTDKKILVAGTGPLLFAVAEYLKVRGAKVALIAEQSPALKIYKFASSLARHPKKIVEAIRLRTKLMNVPYLTDCYVTSAEGDKRLEAVNLRRKAKNWRVECDYLACGFHLVPNIQLASLLGCQIENKVVKVNEYQEASLSGIYCAGEPTGIGGVELSLTEGRIAGLAAVGEMRAARGLFPARKKAQNFAAALNRAFAVRDELKYLADDATLICRCEDVDLGRLKPFDSWRSAKLQTRCGMGPCQGQICGPAVEFLLGWKTDGVRPPIFPVSLEGLTHICEM